MASMTDEGTAGAGPLLVITLTSGTTPMPLRVPFVHELERFTVFRSRTAEDGHEHFYLHVGYFDCEAKARAALEVVRKYYAMAEIRPAPGSNLGSLDDTLNTEFRMVSRASARVVERTPTPVRPRPLQRHAVRLGRWELPGGAPPLPRLALFRALSVYAVQAHHDEQSFQEIRLGFFVDVHRARRVAEALRTHFPHAAVVPVSDREFGRVQSLATAQAQAARVAALQGMGTRVQRPHGQAGMPHGAVHHPLQPPAG